MDYKKIDKLLDKYFEGLTTLQEEKQLKAYFLSENIKPEHRSYQPMFSYYKTAHTVTNPNPFRLNIKHRNNYKKIIAGIAAALILGLGIWSFQFNNFNNTGQTTVSSKVQISNPEKEKEALKEIKKYSHEINKGIEQTGALSIFGITTKKIFKLKNKEK